MKKVYVIVYYALSMIFILINVLLNALYQYISSSVFGLLLIMILGIGFVSIFVNNFYKRIIFILINALVIILPIKEMIKIILNLMKYGMLDHIIKELSIILVIIMMIISLFKFASLVVNGNRVS
ncbi:hypothetical protein MYP_5015 [Sporocytophaga myxococcoides]|uniref:Uncharacterized protein n=1 Tax=Sporocytophaga myxococcoides TaxID=153721 RepID=A0A098LMR0_9BACT|nr:hypothetical protein MYP_5015 [Sporocytophaga myxococcoides]